MDEPLATPGRAGPAVVIAGLATSFVAAIEADERVTPQVAAAVTVAMDGSMEFAAAEDEALALESTPPDEETQAALVEDYGSAQLQALKTGLLVAAAVTLLALIFTRDLPSRRPEPGPVLAEETVEAPAA